MEWCVCVCVCATDVDSMGYADAQAWNRARYSEYREYLAMVHKAQ